MADTASRISRTFAQLRSTGRMAFMPFVTAGDPDLAATAQLIRELARQQVDLIELGFPYSDPIADGPVIQAAYTRALARGLHVRDILDMVRELTTTTPALPPLVAMVSFAIVFKVGPDTFVRSAREAGFSGLIVPDLPGDEATGLAALTRAQGLDLIPLIAPTTTPDRAERILAAASGFLYCISMAGTTGVRERLPDELAAQLRWLRSRTPLPLAVGFGISRPDQVEALRGLADGAIVGSALVKLFQAVADQRLSLEQAISQAGEFAADMVRAAHATP